MRIVIAGGSGFIGRALADALVARGDEVTVPTRSPDRAGRVLPPAVTAAAWDGLDPDALATIIDGADAVVNLVGANIAEGRWTPAVKRSIVESRVQAGRALAEATHRATTAPHVVVQGSAVGYYGGWSDMLTAPVSAEDAPCGAGFLAETCQQWEASSSDVAEGVRHCVIRTGVVLGKGGALAKMLPPFRLFAGGPPGTGRQPFAWIHLSDEVRAIVHLIDHATLSGPFNLTAPGCISMADFCHALGKVLHRPSFTRVPAPLLRLMLGEMAEEVLLRGQVAPPERLLVSGFSFTHTAPIPALEDILRRR